MQIHELTQQQLDEGLLDAIKVGLSRDPRFANMTLSQKYKTIQNDQALKVISDRAWDSWVTKLSQIEKARKGNLSQQDYESELRSYMQNTVLPRYTDYNSLNVKSQLDQTIRAIASMFLRGDRNNAKKYFDQAVDLATVARVDTSQSVGQQTKSTTRAATQQSVARPATGPAAAQSSSLAQAEVQKLLAGVGIGKNQVNTIIQGLTALQSGQPLAAGSTQNPVADAVLRYFGYRI